MLLEVRIRFITLGWKFPVFSTSSISIRGQDEERAEAGGKELDTELDLGLWASPSCMW